MTVLELHDHFDELRAQGDSKVYIERDFESNYDSLNCMIMGRVPAFIGGYPPTTQQEYAVQGTMERTGLLCDEFSLADTNYFRSDYHGITIGASVDPAAIRCEDAEDKANKLLDTEETAYRIPGGLDRRQFHL